MPDILPAVVNLETLTAQILMLKEQTIANMLEIGRRLIQARELIGQGNWLRYLKEQVEFSERTAYRFMKAAEELGSLPPVANLTPSKAYLLLEAPEDARPALAERAGDMTKRELEAKVRELNDERRRREDAERRAAEAEQKAQAVRQELAETGRRLEKAVREADAAKNQPPKVVEKTVHDPDDARKIVALERELTALKTQIAKPEQTEQRLKLLEERLVKVKEDYDRLTTLRDQALTVNQSISALIDVGTRQRGVLEIAVGKQLSGDWFDASQAQDCIGLLEAICKDLRRLVKDSTPSTIDIQ